MTTPLNQNLLLLLKSQGLGRKAGALPEFSGGDGIDPNLAALLMSQNKLRRHIGMDGKYILPNQNNSAFPGLDAYKALQTKNVGSPLSTLRAKPKKSNTFKYPLAGVRNPTMG